VCCSGHAPARRPGRRRGHHPPGRRARGPRPPSRSPAAAHRAGCRRRRAGRAAAAIDRGCGPTGALSPRGSASAQRLSVQPASCDDGHSGSMTQSSQRAGGRRRSAGRGGSAGRRPPATARAGTGASGPARCDRVVLAGEAQPPRQPHGTWVSTTTPSLRPKPLDSTTLAVLRATPGRASSSSIVPGTSPPWRSSSRRAVACRFFAFWRNSPSEADQLLDPLERRRRDRLRAGQLANSTRVTSLTFTSVDCADSIVAASSSQRWRSPARSSRPAAPRPSRSRIDRRPQRLAAVAGQRPVGITRRSLPRARPALAVTGRTHRRPTAHAHRGGSIGRVTVKVVPSPSRLSTRIVPPWRSTAWRTIDSPSPVPPVSRDRAVSTR
jgi:hypothetical protein